VYREYCTLREYTKGINIITNRTLRGVAVQNLLTEWEEK
jgi:hypothetical protein